LRSIHNIAWRDRLHWRDVAEWRSASRRMNRESARQRDTLLLPPR